MSKVYLEDSVLTDIADAIREKTGESGTITPADMATEIESISGGGGEPIELSQPLINISGGLYEKMIFDNQIVCNKYTASSLSSTMNTINKCLFSQSEYESLPQLLILKNLKKLSFLNQTQGIGDVTISANWIKFFKIYANEYSTDYVWTQGPYIIESIDLGKFYILDELIPASSTYFAFSGTPIIFDNLNWHSYSEYQVRSALNYVRPLIKNLDDENKVFENYIKEIHSKIKKSRGGSGGYGIICFTGQWYLNEIPGWYVEFLKLISDYNNSNYSSYFNNMYYECYKLKTVYFPTLPYASTTRAVKYTPRLRHIIFIPGKLCISNGATINLQNAGFKTSDATDKQDVCPDDKKIYDATTYEALKNDPDAWAGALEWSFYGHSAAVETLVSLPNQNPCPDGYNRPCTITFDSNSGLNTDDGPISNLTTEEIAVATDKGWTVSLV